jgi:hypothetical protein
MGTTSSSGTGTFAGSLNVASALGITLIVFISFSSAALWLVASSVCPWSQGGLVRLRLQGHGGLTHLLCLVTRLRCYV